MTRLLVSVRNADEAESALRAGVDLIDVKEPSRGSLGAAEASVVVDVAQRVAGRVPLSRATGELREQAFAWQARGKEREASAGVQRALGAYRFAKCGLARCGSWDGWREALAEWKARLPETTSAVAVVYADRAAEAPEPLDVLMAAEAMGCRGILVDTHDKRHGGLLRHWTLEQVARFTEDVRRRGLLMVLAGSLTAEAIGKLLPLGPDYVAVRGAACRAGRESQIDEARVRHLVRLVASASALSVS